MCGARFHFDLWRWWNLPSLLIRSRLRPQAALEDLQYLKDTSPEESNVLFQLAKVYRLTGDNVKFTQLLAEVRDVAPKSLAKIRRLAESIKPQDVGEEVMDEG